jgi:tetratricopeptide (TPR) repeat protein
VTLQPPRERSVSSTASEDLADSYLYQSQALLPDALRAARAAVERSPEFGLGWVRVAELEFSFGRTRTAHRALNEALRLVPRHAAAMALRGFVLSAENRIGAALNQFEVAIATDGALGNAWLGRGLCRIRRGDLAGGRQDIQIAATLEPQRAIFRSYLGKAYSEVSDGARAGHEIFLAKEFDPKDPTAWLYSGLLHQQQNRINEAIADLEESEQLHQNRRVYRSRLLLDQDRAVQGANLASAYQDAGMDDVAVREAARAVTYDYANASAHLFLANSFNRLRDPKQVDLRYETAWFSEFLMANLLAPVGAGRLSQAISQNEYSKLFERDRLGIVSSTEYYSHGEWYETAVQHGTFGNSSYAAEAFYHSSDGFRPDAELRQLAFNLRLKQQLTPQDSLFGQIGHYQAKSGDITPYYDPASAIAGFRYRETQEPTVLIGHHHQWNPGLHTVWLTGFVQDNVDVDNPQQNLLRLSRDLNGMIDDAFPIAARLNYRSEQELYSGEIQQIWQGQWFSLQTGVRYQAGEIRTRSEQDNFLSPPPGVMPQDSQHFATDFDRASAYLYGQFPVTSGLWLVGGVSYDHVTFPVNFRFSPLTNRTDTTERVSPKAGLIWTPARDTAVRAAYTRGLGGVSLDQSYRLEPSQVAGFNQAFRSIIPESSEGPVSAPKLDSWDLSLEQKFGRGTYLGVWGQLLKSEVDRVLGVIENGPIGPPGPLVPRGDYPSGTRQSLDYWERSIGASAYQLLGDWSFGGRYKFSCADLDKTWLDIPASVAALGGFPRQENLEACLHQLKLFAVYHHPSGLFTQVESLWNSQSNEGYAGTRPGDDFWQFNVLAGYRFLRRKVELQTGILNLTDQDYRLNPLNLTVELPRERTWFLGLRFAF